MSSYQAIAGQFKTKRKMPRQYKQNPLKWSECRYRAEHAKRIAGGNLTAAIKTEETSIAGIPPHRLAYREGKQVIRELELMATTEKQNAERDAQREAEEKRERRIDLAVKLLRSAGMNAVAEAIHDSGVKAIIDLAISLADDESNAAMEKSQWDEMNLMAVIGHRLSQVRDELFDSSSFATYSSSRG